MRRKILKIRLHPLAVDDLDAGRTFYERQQPGLGVYFLDALFSDIDSLLIYAGIHTKVHGYYRSLSKRFPYAIYYRVSGDDGDEIQVLRVLDCRAEPVSAAMRLAALGDAAPDMADIPRRRPLD